MFRNESFISCAAWITLDVDLRALRTNIHLLVFLVGGQFTGYPTPQHCIRSSCIGRFLAVNTMHVHNGQL